jgi:pyruvate formate lyase activating enzyme
MTPFTTIDYPGKMAAVVFLKGCPWRCKYCSNPVLFGADRAPKADVKNWEKIIEFLKKRAGLLEAVVFSGGEATMQADALIPAIEEIKAIHNSPLAGESKPQSGLGGGTRGPHAEQATGFPRPSKQSEAQVVGRGKRRAGMGGYFIGLHTNGALPENLKKLLPHVDWVGLDIKADKANYDALTGAKNSWENAVESLDAIIAWGGEFEVRTTLDPRFISKESLMELAEFLRARGVKNYAVQKLNQVGLAGNDAPAAFYELFDEDKLRAMFAKFEVRG